MYPTLVKTTWEGHAVFPLIEAPGAKAVVRGASIFAPKAKNLENISKHLYRIYFISIKTNSYLYFKLFNNLLLMPVDQVLVKL